MHGRVQCHNINYYHCKCKVFSTSSLSSIIAPFSNKISTTLTLPTEAAHQRAVFLFTYNIKIRLQNTLTRYSNTIIYTPYFKFGSAFAARRAATVSAESSLSATNIRLVNPSYASPKIIVIEVNLIIMFLLHSA